MAIMQMSQTIEQALNELDPDRIYVENVRSILRVNTRFARFICKTAERQGFFEKHYAVECRNDDCGRVIESFKSKSEIPDKVTCILCEMEKKEKSTFDINELEIVEYYKYVRNR